MHLWWELNHECPSTIIVLLNIYVHLRLEKINMFAIFLCCNKEKVEVISRTNLFFQLKPSIEAALKNVKMFTLLQAFLYKIKGL